ncbi:MAG: universal stress protein [Kiloniellales bacterium]|nr:universal stress protein [Kiloniellales bacterium]
MKRFKNILLICDERSIHEAVIGRAIWLAKANQASLTLVDVVEAAPGELTSLFAALPGGRGREVEYEVLEFHRARLAQIAAPIKSEGVETSEIVLQGIPFVEIIRKVLRDGHDLIMKGAAGRSEGESLFFASTDLHLLRKCPCPVWVMKKSARRQYARVLAAVDPETADEKKGGLNRLILDLATSLSEVDGSDLHVVNAWRLEEEDTLRHSGFARVAKDEVDLLVDGKRKQNEQKLMDLLRAYPDGGSKRHVHLLKGAAREVIPVFAAKQRVELIVMGTVGRTGIRGLIIGNSAEAILNQVECSVLAVKPPGFETPVELETPAVAAPTRAQSM